MRLHRNLSLLAVFLLAGFALAIVGSLNRILAHDRPSGPLYKTRSAVLARDGMAATSQPLATAAALRVQGVIDVLTHENRPPMADNNQAYEDETSPAGSPVPSKRELPLCPTRPTGR